MKLKNAEATYDINLGVDHRSLNVELVVAAKVSKPSDKNDKQRRKTSMWGWQPTDKNAYMGSLDAEFDSFCLEHNITYPEFLPRHPES